MPEDIPAKFSDIKVPVYNAEKRSQVITKGTELGVLHEAKVMYELPEEETKVEEEPTSLENEAIEKIMSKLLNKINEE